MNTADIYKKLDEIYTILDKQHIRRTRNIRLIPIENQRRGGKYSYAEWAHVIGIFQTLLYIHLKNKNDNYILDVGCGTGLMGIAAEPFLEEQGKYLGIDVSLADIQFCRSHFPPDKYEFQHLKVTNAAYAPNQSLKNEPWELEGNLFDMVTALSVWTHFREEDAIFYFKEVQRVLKPGGRAIITFFLLDEYYYKNLHERTNSIGKFHMTPQNQWIFDQSAYGSDAWFTPSWTEVPENAIGVTSAGLKRLLSGTNLKEIEYYPGNWKEIPGVFFQDVLVFEKF